MKQFFLGLFTGAITMAVIMIGMPSSKEETYNTQQAFCFEHIQYGLVKATPFEATMLTLENGDNAPIPEKLSEVKAAFAPEAVDCP